MMTKGRFPHRTNADGTIDAICPECFVTVATSPYEADLEAIETSHRCDPALLNYCREQLIRALKRAVRFEDSPGTEWTKKVGSDVPGPTSLSSRERGIPRPSLAYGVLLVGTGVGTTLKQVLHRTGLPWVGLNGTVVSMPQREHFTCVSGRTRPFPVRFALHNLQCLGRLVNPRP